ncbi:MAG TPA: PfkB family carbohydrate kinase, partial [Parafilimonas sp.]|nr:PfkB family carbohydrate kinase [Parafilimonas sp.]
MTNFESLFKDFSSLRVGVVGDVMLDTYWWGNVERISPEAPVPIVALHHREQRIGGAGNVALNAVSLGAETSVFSVTGDDADSNILNGLLNKHHINTRYLVKSSDRITTNKIRVMSRNQQMLRIDSEIVNNISSQDEQQLFDNFSGYVQDTAPSVVIFEDYNKGVLTPTLIQSMIQLCKKHEIVTAVDPKRKNFFLYEHVDIFKPN